MKVGIAGFAAKLKVSWHKVKLDLTMIIDSKRKITL